jgi:hypothetical protein
MQPDEKSGASFKGVLLLHSLTSEQQTVWQHDKSKEQTSEIKAQKCNDASSELMTGMTLNVFMFTNPWIRSFHLL